MPQPRPDPNHGARLLLSLMPAEVRKAASPGELARRLDEARRLSAQASDLSLDPLLRAAAKRAAQDVLTAPVPVRKAKADDGNAPVVLFDADGRVLGICDPSDIQPVTGSVPVGEMTPQPPGEAGIPAQAVAKSGRVIVLDQWGRRYAADPRRITRIGKRAPVAKAAPVKGMVRVTGDDGRSYWADPADLKGPGSPEAQARDAGPVKAGGTTGMGTPRKTGPAGSLPGDGPQRALPGDLADRQVVKSLGSGWTPVHHSTGSLAGVVKQADIIAMPSGQVLKGGAAQRYANVYDAAGHRVGVARLADITHLADLRGGRGRGR